MIHRFLLIFLLLATSCSAQEANQRQQLLDALDCDRKEPVGNMPGVLDAEAKDRPNYHPLSAEVIPIKMRNPAKGYHGPTRGIYILIVEQYPTEQDAARRAREYRDNYGERVGDPEQKSTVRCWAQTDGTRVYLLTTHAAMYIALEELTHGIQTRLTKYLREQPTPR